MDNAWLAAFLGFLEGLTEFIPVSSTGHLLLAGRALGFESAGRVFEVAIQLGAVLALLAVYGARILQLAGKAPQDAAARRFLASVLLAFLPAAFLGVLAHDFIKEVLFETPRLIAVMLILGGVVLLFADRLAGPPRWAGAEDLPLRTAFLIGCFQTLALIPGVSRSGATIVGGLLLGTGKRAAAEFSFYLSLPTMAGAVTYDLWKSRALLGAGDWAEIALGFAVAFVTALFVVRGLLAFVSRHGYAVFGWWRIALGLAALVFFSL